MRPHKFPELHSAGARIDAVLTWLGGGHWRELGERYERSSHAIAGLVVLLGAALAWLVATLAVAESTRWPIPAILALTLVFGLLTGAVTRAIASGPTRGWSGMVGRGAVAVAVGVVVGELAALVLFSGSINGRLDEQAARNADSAPAVVQASADLNRTRHSRTALDDAVEQARAHRDEALVVARCEYNPTPACPQTRITGVAGVGPETQSANELLASAQMELDNALAARDRRAPELDSEIAHGEQALAQARTSAIASADRGLGARWVAMHNHTLSSAAALLLRLLTIAFFALLSLLPLILKLWRGETTHDRSAAARAERDLAELRADTAIAVKRAEVRVAAEIMWADQQLANARLAVEAQTEIDRAQHRRRVTEALGGPVQAPSQREPVQDDMYLSIAEADGPSRAAAQLPAGGQNPRADKSENLPARVESGGAVEPGERGTPLIPTIPDVTKAAARWIRPLVPPLIARAFDTTTQPLRAARQVFEEVEEITFFRRTHKVTVNSQESPEQPRQVGSVVADARVDPGRDESEIVGPHDGDYGLSGRLDAQAERSSLSRAPAEDLSLGPTELEGQPELTDRDGPRELRGPDGPRQLPPAE
jgi:hypothetical protein